MEVSCSHNEASTRVRRGADNGSFRTSSTPFMISMTRLYTSGLSFQEVSEQLGFCANTVRNCVHDRRVHARTTRSEIVKRLDIEGLSGA